MFKKKNMLLLTSALCLGLAFIKPMDVNAQSYKFSISAESTMSDTISSIKIGGVTVDTLEDSAISFTNSGNGIHYVVTNSGTRISRLLITDSVDSVTEKLLSCDKSNFISEGTIYTDIEHTESNGMTLTTYRKDDRKYAIYHNDELYIKLNSFHTDEILYGNSYINTVLDSIEVTYEE